jgi:hypothetical protein
MVQKKMGPRCGNPFSCCFDLVINNQLMQAFELQHQQIEQR